ncbi:MULTISPECIES: glycosyltransferase family 4 protein [unclassified Methylococcus]|uniref:glycosyltransferase family 4 protein n=1 Tax=unclassified Methylococcus TaxID=2618889 RepID=UPI003D7E5350
MKLALISDAWRPQVNGVVTTLSRICEGARQRGHQVETFTPDCYRNWPCPGYPEIRLALGCGSRLPSQLDAFAPDAIHIATEGPLGMAARRYCLQRRLPFTTSFHTRFAEYVNLRTGLPLRWGYAALRWFHRPSVRVMAPTPTQVSDLRARGFRNLVLWSRGVDTTLFAPRGKARIDDVRPVFMYVGRLAVEKGLDDFLRLDLPGVKYVVGDGPSRTELQKRYPDVRFLGYRCGLDLAETISAADVFVFPSRTDTFGLVMLEALAAGVPVAAYPVPGPQDVITDPSVGCLDHDLRAAALRALELRSEDCRKFAERFTWDRCTEQFLGYLAPISR